MPGTRSQPVRHYPEGGTPTKITSAVLLQSAPNAAYRNMQNIEHLSSGAYGRFTKPSIASGTADTDNNRVSLPRSQRTSPMVSQRSEPQTSARNELTTSGRGDFHAHSQSETYERKLVARPTSSATPYAQMTERTKMKSMLADMDSSFSRRNKYDLSTAVSGPPGDIGHLRMFGVANYKNFEEGGRWSRSLRKSGKDIVARK